MLTIGCMFVIGLLVKPGSRDAHAAERWQESLKSDQVLVNALI